MDISQNLTSISKNYFKGVKQAWNYLKKKVFIVLYIKSHPKSPGTQWYHLSNKKGHRDMKIHHKKNLSFCHTMDLITCAHGNNLILNPCLESILRDNVACEAL